MTVDSFIRAFKDIEVDINNDTKEGIIEIILPKINYAFWRLNYEHISHMSDETAFYIAYGLYKTLILLESEKCKKMKTDKWLWSFDGKAILIQCPKCGLHYDSWVRGFNYCPHCGVKMEEQDG